MSPGVVLVDTSALLAIANPRDQYHSQALVTARQHLAAGGRFVGTVLVLAELHGHLLHRRGAAEARRVIAALMHDPAYEWRPVSPADIADAHSAWLERFHDQAFSLTDALSFRLMAAEGIDSAFAYDEDFRAAGYTLLR